MKIVQILLTRAHPTVYAQSATLVILRQYVGGVTTTTGVVELAQVPVMIKTNITLCCRYGC